MINNYVLAGSTLLLQSWEHWDTKFMSLIRNGVSFHSPRNEMGIEKLSQRVDKAVEGVEFFSNC